MLPPEMGVRKHVEKPVKCRLVRLGVLVHSRPCHTGMVISAAGSPIPPPLVRTALGQGTPGTLMVGWLKSPKVKNLKIAPKKRVLPFSSGGVFHRDRALNDSTLSYL